MSEQVRFAEIDEPEGVARPDAGPATLVHGFLEERDTRLDLSEAHLGLAEQGGHGGQPVVETVVPAQLQTALERWDRTLRRSFSDVRRAQTGQGRGQRERAVGRFAQLDRLATRCLGVGELTEFRQYARQPAAHQDRSVRGKSKRGEFAAVGLDHVVESLEVGAEDRSRSTGIATRQMDETEIEARFCEKGRGGQAFRERQGSFSGLQRGVEADDGPEVLTQITSGPALSPPIADGSGQRLGLAQMVVGLWQLGECPQRVAQGQPDIDGLFQRRRRRREMAQRAQPLPEELRGLSVCGRSEGPLAGSPQIDDRFVPDLSTKGVMGETIDVLGESLRVDSLDGLDDTGVEHTLSVLENTLIGDLMSQSVLEGVLHAVGQGTRFGEELRRLQTRQLPPELSVRYVGDRSQDGHTHVLPEYGSGLEHVTVLDR